MKASAIFATIFAVIFGALIPASAGDIRVVTYNVESDSDTDPKDVAKDIKKIGKADIWALQEVDGSGAMFTLREAIQNDGQKMWFELGVSGGSDRLAIVYDQNRFEALEGPEELVDVGGSRPPLWMKLVEKDGSGSINVIVNHLNRGDSSLRRKQAAGLRRWISQTDEPTVILGDFNFDLKVDDWVNGSLEGNRAFHIFTQSPSPAIWLQHFPQISTQCSTKYNSVLDFIFVSGEATNWEAETEVLFPDGSYCANEPNGGADHRPIVAVLKPNADAPPSTDDEILSEIERLREQLEELEAKIRAR